MNDRDDCIRITVEVGTTRATPLGGRSFRPTSRRVALVEVTASDMEAGGVRAECISQLNSSLGVLLPEMKR